MLDDIVDYEGINVCEGVYNLRAANTTRHFIYTRYGTGHGFKVQTNILTDNTNYAKLHNEASKEHEEKAFDDLLKGKYVIFLNYNEAKMTDTAEDRLVVRFIHIVVIDKDSPLILDLEDAQDIHVKVKENIEDIYLRNTNKNDILDAVSDVHSALKNSKKKSFVLEKLIHDLMEL